MLKVLYITRKHPPSVGGMQRLSSELRAALSRHLCLKTIAWGRSQSWLFIFLPLALVRAIVEFQRREPVSVVLIGDPVLAPLGVVLRKLFRKPILCVLHGLDLTYPNSIYQSIFIGCLRKLDAFVAISHGTRRLAIERGIDANRCSVIPVGIDPTRFANSHQPGNLSSCKGLPIDQWKSSGQLLLLTTGRLVPRKGVGWFIQEVFQELLRAYPNLRYLVVGSGPERRRIQRLVEKLKLTEHVRFLDQVSEDLLVYLYQSADIFVMPNMPIEGDYEGFGIVALEAAMNGLCVVAADIEGIAEAIEPGKNGWLVPAGDPAAYLQILRRLLSDQELRSSFAAGARNHILAHYRWDDIGIQYLKLIEELLNRHNCRTLALENHS
jgi:glycosyltransferase involved in cell wall biosynthesis